MAFTRSTIIRRMLEASGKSAEEVSVGIGKDSGYVDNILLAESGGPTVNSLNLIAHECGYALCFVGNGESLELATYRPPVETRDEEFVGSYECDLSGLTFAVTGGFYGLSDSAIASMLGAIGASYVTKLGKKSTDALIVGDLSAHGGKSSQLENAKRWGKRVISAEEFRQTYLEVTGKDIAAL